MVKIGKNQTIAYYTIPNLPTGVDFFVADIDTSGYYYISSGIGSREYYTVDLKYKVDIENRRAEKFSRISSPTSNNDGASCALASILPVELKSFKANQSGRNVTLKWVTASEKLNLGFEIHHSSDGENWNTLDFIYSKTENGNSNEILEYTYLHESPHMGENYYRLKQKDYDGKFEWSKIESVFIEKEYAFHIYPNPFKDKLYLQGLTSENYITITNSLGAEIVKRYHIDTKINLAELAPGYYLLGVFSSDHHLLHSYPIVKQ